MADDGVVYELLPPPENGQGEANRRRGLGGLAVRALRGLGRWLAALVRSESATVVVVKLLAIILAVLPLLLVAHVVRVGDRRDGMESRPEPTREARSYRVSRPSYTLRHRRDSDELNLTKIGLAMVVGITVCGLVRMMLNRRRE